MFGSPPNVSVCELMSLTMEVVEASMATRRANAIVDEVVPFFQKSILRGKVVMFGCWCVLGCVYWRFSLFLIDRL